VWVLRASGFRASIAAGLLQRLGYQPVVLANGGVADVLGHLPSESAISTRTARIEQAASRRSALVRGVAHR
jgi:hypothetical protein